ncbi:MAG: nuclear transport factor 2 family protein [Porticoccaceae bacterium]|jgi:ketosteroid isomerase-like protein
MNTADNNPAANKSAVETYFDAVNSMDESRILALLADDFSIISMNRNPPVLRYQWDAKQFAAAPRLMSARMKKPIQLRLIAMTAENDRVAVEADSHGEMLDGTVYENAYHFLFTFRGDKIVEVREYCCSYTAFDVFGKYLSDKGEHIDANGPG